MRKIIYFFILTLTALPAWAINDTLYVNGTLPADKTSKELTIRLSRSSVDSNASVLQVVEANGANTEFKLLKKIIVKDTLYEISDTSQGRKLLEYLAIDTASLYAQFKAIYKTKDSSFNISPLNHFINRVAAAKQEGLHLSIRKIITVAPPADNAFPWHYVLIGAGVLVLLSTIFFMAKGTRKKDKTADASLAGTVKELLQLRDYNYSEQNLAEKLSSHLDIKDSEIIELKKNIAELQQALAAKENELFQMKSLDQWDQQYRTKAMEQWVKPFSDYFSRQNPYPPDPETKRKLTESLVSMAFHYSSYVRYRAGAASENDRYNVAAVAKVPFTEYYQYKNVLSKTTVNPAPGSVPNLVQYIADMLREAGSTSVKDVNIQGYQIEE
jgi:hypothetical protein